MTVHPASLRIADAEHRARCDALLERINDQRLSGVVLFDADYIKYYTGFAFIPTERPIAFAMNAQGERSLFVPRLEVEHAQANALVEHVTYYAEYPGDPHPAQVLADMLRDMGFSSAAAGGSAGIAADSDGYPHIFGYYGPALSELLGVTVQNIRRVVETQMMVKSPAEIALLRESCRWANLAHMLLQRYTLVGASETAVSQRASDEATRAMLDAIGPVYRAQPGVGSPHGAAAGYRGQIGRNSAIPHALANNITFQRGDVLVTGATAAVWGYVGELERTMIIGEASTAQKRMFEHMLALQNIAFRTLEAGIPCSEVDKAVRAYYREHDLMPNWRHHVGHAIGLRYHESPFLDIGDTTVMQPGMVFTIEPGLYAPELGGFRHSDTVVITSDGIEMLTYYPRDLASLTLPG